ncbi:MAG: hypothetical protein M3R13_08165 [Armatimonadota bacterium]|nr:hypothetical protein [Armatimonadota bacterium]
MTYRLGVAEPIAALNRVHLIECGEPLVDLQLELPDLKVLRPSAIPWARAGVADRLSAARKAIAPYDIGLREAWRSLDRQKFIYDHYFNSLNQQFSFATRRRLANRFFAPYDQKAPPGHSTGAAIDVWLLDENGEPISLDGPGRRFKSAPTFSAKLPASISEKRLILHDAMVSVGFTNCRDEWWHFSYGDAGWAVRCASPVCIYGSIHPAAEEYEEKDRTFFEEFLRNPPF